MAWRKKLMKGRLIGMFDQPTTSSVPILHSILLGSMESTDYLGAALHREATSGNRKALKKVLNTAIFVDYPNDMGQTPLFCACARDRESTGVLLLESGANPNERCINGMTPCHAACCVGNIILLGKLIEAGGDLRLHDNEGNGMKEWAMQNPDAKKRTKTLEFLDQTHIYAVAYSGDATDVEKFGKLTRRSQRQTSLMEIMRLRTSSESSFENLKRVQSMGFGKVYLGRDQHGGIISVVPMVSEAALFVMDRQKFNTGCGSFMEGMLWWSFPVSVKQVVDNADFENGIDLLIAEAEYLGKLRHPNILLLMGISQSVQLDRLMLITEFVEKATLHHVLHSTNQLLSNAAIMSMIQQVCAAMDFIQNHSLIHCGLSSMAIYIVSPHTTKVGNFEFMVESLKSDMGKPSNVSLVRQGEALYHWMSPEMLRGQPPQFSSDVYSFCSIIWEIFSNEVPWGDFQPQDIKYLVGDQGKSLNLKIARLPSKLHTILDFGLASREEERLNKFSYISKWLRSDQNIPKFRRSHTSLVSFQGKNRSSNFRKQTSSLSSDESSFDPVNCAARNAGNTWLKNRSDITDKVMTADVMGLGSPVDMSDGEKPAATESSYDSCNSDSVDPKPIGRFHHEFSDPAKLTVLSGEPVNSSTPLSDHATQMTQEPPQHSVSSVKPASHMTTRQLSPSSADSRDISLLERNNNGWSSQWTKSATLPRDFTPHPRSRDGEPRPGMDQLHESSSVKKLAQCFQQHLNQHKLRQAILKGSMAPRGSCPDLESSSDSSDGGKKANEKETKPGYHNCSDNKTVQKTRSDFSARILHSRRLLQMSTCSSPKAGQPGKMRTESSMSVQSRDQDFLGVFYSARQARNIGTDCVSVADVSGDDRKSRFHSQEIDVSADFMDGVVTTHAGKDNMSLCHKPRTARCESDADLHRTFLKEITDAHWRLLGQPKITQISQSPAGCYYSSPTITIHTATTTDGQGKDVSTCDTPETPCTNMTGVEDDQSQVVSSLKSSAELTTPDTKEAQGKDAPSCDTQETPFTNVTSLEDDQSQVLSSLKSSVELTTTTPSDCKVKMPKSDSQVPKLDSQTAVSGHEVDSVWTTAHSQPADDTSYFELSASTQQEESCLSEQKHTGASQVEMNLPCSPGAEEGAIRVDSDTCQHRQDDARSSEHPPNMLEDFTCEQTMRNSSSPPMTTHRESGSKEDLREDNDDDDGDDRENSKKSINDSTFIIDSYSQVTDEGTGIRVDSGTSLSSALERCGVNCQQPKDKNGYSERKEKIAEKGTVFSHTEKSSSINTGLKPEDGKLVSEVDCSDFELREFYIDDDFDSTGYVEPADPPLNCNVALRHVSSDAHQMRWNEKPASGKTAPVTACLTTGKPPGFPRKLKMSHLDQVVSQWNVSQSALSRETADRAANRRVPLHKSASDGSKQHCGGLPRTSSTARSRDGILRKAGVFSNTDCLRSGRSDPSLGFGPRSDDLKKKWSSQKEEDNTSGQVTGDILEDEADGSVVADTDPGHNGKMGNTHEDQQPGRFCVASSVKVDVATQPADPRTARTQDPAVMGTHYFRCVAKQDPVHVGMQNIVSLGNPNSLHEEMEDKVSVEGQSSVSRGVQSSMLSVGNNQVMEATQTSPPVTLHRAEMSDSDSMESDQWIKMKLRAIRSRIKRRRERGGYYVSSDDESDNDDDENEETLTTDHGVIGLGNGSDQRRDELTGENIVDSSTVASLHDVHHDVSNTSTLVPSISLGSTRRSDQVKSSMSHLKTTETNISPQQDQHSHGLHRGGSKSILRKPQTAKSLSEFSGQGTTTSLVSFASGQPKAKLCASEDSRSTTKAVNFLHNSEDWDKNMTSPPLLSQNSVSDHTIVPQGQTQQNQTSSVSISKECDDKRIKVWLEKQNFTELSNHTGSGHRADGQSITSKIMELQSSASDRHSGVYKTTSTPSRSAVSAQNSKTHHVPSNRSRMETEIPECVSDRFSKDASDQYPSRREGRNRGRRLHGGDDHCLTVNLKPLSAATANEMYSEDTKSSPVSTLHRFYIPHEAWAGGCQTRLNVQIDPSHPGTQRVTTIARDPASGHTETLLDQTITTDRLRSIIQID